MAKEQVTALTTANNAQDGLTPQSAAQEANVLIKSFEDVKLEQLQQLTAEYLELEPNKQYNFIFTGMVKFMGQKGEIDAVELVDNKGEKGISGLTVLVNSLK